MTNQDGLAWKIATGEAHLTVTDNRVWIALQCRAESWNYVAETQKHIAGLIGMAQSHFNASIRKLIEMDMIIRTPDTGKGAKLMLNPFMFWKGDAKDQKGAQSMYRRLAERGRKA